MCKDVVEIIYFWHITGSGIIDSCPQQTLPKIEFSQSWFLYFVYSLLNCAAMQFACHQKKISLWLVWLQICNIRTRLCLSWPKICYSWTRIWLFWRPKIHYFLDKHKVELQGAYHGWDLGGKKSCIGQRPRHSVKSGSSILPDHLMAWMSS